MLIGAAYTARPSAPNRRRVIYSPHADRRPRRLGRVLRHPARGGGGPPRARAAGSALAGAQGPVRARGRLCPALSAALARARRALHRADAPGRCRDALADDRQGLTCVAEEHALPFPDLSFDRVLLVHGLEAAENRRVLLREVWRVLKDDGRLLVLVPNRTGLWAYAESTPFGHGQPFSVGQIGRLLADSLFRAERSDAALYMPPTGFMLRSAVYAERIGPRIAPGFGGVILVEALKDAYAALPLAGAPRRRLVVEEAAA